MSIRLMTKVFGGIDVDVHTFAVLIAMADFANDDGVGIYPAIATIARKCRVSPRQVQRIVSRLERDGVLVRIRTGGGRESASWRMVEAKLDELLIPPPLPSDADPKWPRRAPGTGVRRGVQQTPVQEPGASKGRPPVTGGGVHQSPGGASGSHPIRHMEPSLEPGSASAAAEAQSPNGVRKFQLGPYITAYAEEHGGVLVADRAARPLQAAEKLHGPELTLSAWRLYLRERKASGKFPGPSWFAEDVGRWVARAQREGVSASANGSTAPSLVGWARAATPTWQQGDRVPGWDCSECDRRQHRAYDTALIGKCPVRLGLKVDEAGRVVGP